ncbi:MAG: adenylate/guanylate cyclase domain-containing protein [Gaiellaceae bacterium]
MEPPKTRYARSGDVSIAYQVAGDGPFDLVWVPPWVTNVELAWDLPWIADVIQRLSSFNRLIRLDKRGTGLSDRVAIVDLETRMDDVRAVMDAAGSESAALFGRGVGGPLSILFAATYPERVWGLALWATFPRTLWAPDYPVGETEEERERELERDLLIWTDPDRALALAIAQPGIDADATRKAHAYFRQSASPGAVRALHEMNHEIDVRHVLGAIRCPTLVFHRAGDRRLMVGGSRYIAEHVDGAKYVELPGSARPIGAGDSDAALAELQPFLTAAWEAREEREPDRVLATVLFTDIVGSTARAVEMGDRAWRELLEAHHAEVRRALVRYRGKEIDTAGDGFFASFDGPARAIRCAQGIVDAVRPLGLDVRAGVHTGECELIDGKVAGIAVHIGARVAAHAQPGEVLVSSTVRDLVAGSGIAFRDRGEAELKGVPGEWRLFEAVAA